MADAPQIPVGSRVRVKTVDLIVVGDAVKHDTADRWFVPVVWPADPEDVGVSGGWEDAEGVPLVEVAHYAPPGVVMVPMTPERIHALGACVSVAEVAKMIGSHWLTDEAKATIVALLAEARGEVKAR